MTVTKGPLENARVVLRLFWDRCFENASVGRCRSKRGKDSHSVAPGSQIILRLHDIIVVIRSEEGHRNRPLIIESFAKVDHSGLEREINKLLDENQIPRANLSFGASQPTIRAHNDHDCVI